MKNRLTWFFLLVFLGLTAGVIFEWPDRQFHLVVCDVGQGDAILLVHGSSQVLIDGGPNSRVMECLSDHLPFWDREIELIVATHPDKDHIAGLVNVIERYRVTMFVSINQLNKTTVFENLRAEVWQNQLPVHIARKGDQIMVGQIKLKVLSPEKSDHKYLVWENKLEAEKDGQIEESNDQSVVLRVNYDQFDLLLTGDIGASLEKKLTGEQDLSGIEVLKVSHHGSKYGTSQELLEAVKPKLAVIGVGKNQWGHPAEEVIERLAKFKIPVLRTDLEGDIEVVSDGKRWYVKN